MAIIPDLQALREAATSVERTAADVDTDAGGVTSRLEMIPWQGPRRDRVLFLADVAVVTARAQAEAERALARALRELAGAVERELQELAALAERARRHLEELLSRARALVNRAAQELADLAAAAAVAAGLVWDVVTGDVADAVATARSLVQRAEEALRSITLRLDSLPAPQDPLWRTLAREILRWQPL
ncbi:MAG: hypothetical protein AVDCRST_MAG76-2410 [uncultured Acidimicrobiales bacterium]|uniref:Uncharacterized protein n=1 Tax=uncultured Acidimicrobiales bacterium TaxID=310071 RepID=A0A6J4IIA9_9ACTN|nr:MAG: hypothetical protein AVDCRST_MAG76-2410 [uncultured Acidimicrobiales bacterium]